MIVTINGGMDDNVKSVFLAHFKKMITSNIVHKIDEDVHTIRIDIHVLTS